jgi:hypothetical protein
MRRLILVTSVMIIAGASVTGALALQNGSLIPSDEPTITTMFGEEPAGISARMQEAADAGPRSIACDPGEGAALVCLRVEDAEALAALRRGETIYGRNVMGFPEGAKIGETGPKFHSSSLVCGEPVDGLIPCLPVTAEAPTARVGQEFFVYYMRQNVTFLSDGVPVLHIGEPTVPLRVVSE